MMKPESEQCERFENVASNNPFQIGSRWRDAGGLPEVSFARPREGQSLPSQSCFLFQREQPGSANHLGRG
jgi:hypothetical protein